MPSLPPLECLRFFEAAARRESFAKAAEELHVSSSAVAHRIKVLEGHLGGELFERGHRGVRLNGSGKAYLKDVQRIPGMDTERGLNRPPGNRTAGFLSGLTGS